MTILSRAYAESGDTARALGFTPEDVNRFAAEAQSAARLKHPGIVQVYDAGIENGLYYFVMEFVDGYTIGSWIRRKTVLSRSRCCGCRKVAVTATVTWTAHGSERIRECQDT